MPLAAFAGSGKTRLRPAVKYLETAVGPRFQTTQQSDFAYAKRAGTIIEDRHLAHATNLLPRVKSRHAAH